MNHYKCLIRSLTCLHREIPFFTWVLWWTCTLAPCVMVALYYGVGVMVLSICLTFIGSFCLAGLMIAVLEITSILHDWYVEGGFERFWLQCKALPKVLKKCTRCNDGQ